MDFIDTYLSLSPPSSPFAPPSTLYSLLHHPLTFLINLLHRILLAIRGPAYYPPPFSPTRPAIRIVCISDTHTKIPSSSLPPGDLLIHCGDLTNVGTRAEIQRTIDWLKTLQKPWPGSNDGYRHIVVIAGNHDSYFDERSRSNYDRSQKQRLDFGKIHYLQHSSVTLPFPGDPIRKLKVYGAPQIPKCGGKEFAFQYRRGIDAWSNTIPDDVDVLVTHNPPKWHLDIPEAGGQGCEHELKEVWRVKPTLHVFGHVHSGYGQEGVWWDKGQELFEQILETAYGGHEPGQYRQAMFMEMFNVKLWMMGLKLIYRDVKGVLWNRVWGGARQGGIMVNAALTYKTTETLGNKPQVVKL
jgi:Icc-related predicted phosphoesterase